MLRTGNEYLQSLRDNRSVYIGRELVSDVTTHPAFAAAAAMYARMYDMKRDDANENVTWFAEDNERFSLYYLQPRSREDLVKRTKCHRAIANFSHGLLGRSPDHVASSVTGMSVMPEVFGEGPRANYADNVVAYYHKMRHEDLFTCYAILPPQGARAPELYQSHDRKPPTLRVSSEDDRGVTLNGMKMLATGAVYANEALIGNIMPLAPSQIKESITCTLPIATPGLSLWARKPYALNARDRADSPLSSTFDESDSMLVFKDVHVPWERVFVHDNPDQSRNIYIRTPAHVFSNHQSNVRFHAKLRLLVGIASRITRSNGARDVPAVREILGRLAAMEACYGGMIAGQHEAMETMQNGFVHVNRRFMYAAANYALENHAIICDQIRTLCGGGAFQMPASSDVIQDSALNSVFQEYWSTLEESASERMKVFRFAWDLLGSDFAARHDQYEKFYIGPSFVVRNYNFMNAPWQELEELVARGMAGPEPT